MLLTACSNDVDYPQDTEKEGHITFSLPGTTKRIVSYADPVASTEENRLSTLFVYVFKEETDNTGKLEQVFRFGDGYEPMGGDQDNPTVTLDMTGRTGTKKLYFVGNAAGKAANLEKANVGETVESGFLEIISNVQQDMITTPLIMSTIQAIDLDAMTDDMKKVTLVRRVARFDVVNDSDVTNFTIEKILVSGINQQGHLFGNAFGSTAPVTGNLPVIDYSVVTNANQGETASVFYLYPSVLGQGKGTIAFEGLFNNQRKIYELDLTADLEIRTNKRYILKASTEDLNNVKFELNITDWMDDGEHTAEPGPNQIVFPSVDEISRFNIADKGQYVYDITYTTSEAKLYIPVKTYSKSPATISISYEKGDNSITDITINNPEPVLTYSAGYVYNYEITIPTRSDMNQEVEAKIEIINSLDPTQQMNLTVKGEKRIVYPGTSLYPVVVGGVVFSPVNVGATAATARGKFYQWGRTYAAPWVTPGTAPAETEVIAGPKAAEVANKFITTTIQPHDWLNPQNDALWPKGARGPCPAGWRLGTREEWDEVVQAFFKAKEEGKTMYASNRFAIPGDNPAETLYLPNGIRHNNGYCTEEHAYYWGTSDFFLHERKGIQFHINQTLLISSVGEQNRVYGFQIRCVKQ